VVSAEGLELTPFIVFVTADPTAAVPAFDLEAVDFLLKPYDAVRRARALERARAAVGRRAGGAIGGGGDGGGSPAATPPIHARRPAPVGAGVNHSW